MTDSSGKRYRFAVHPSRTRSVEPKRTPHHRDPDVQPQKSILRRDTGSSDGHSATTEDKTTRSSNSRSPRSSRSRSPRSRPQDWQHDPMLTGEQSLPSIMRELEARYSAETLERYPPVLLPSLWGRNACLAEPYEVTLRRLQNAPLVGRFTSPKARKKNLNSRKPAAKATSVL